MGSSGILARQWKTERRSKRIFLSVPVSVYGWGPDDSPFCDLTRSVSISAHGGLLTLEPAVRLGQKLLVMNSNTQEELECRVVHVGPAQEAKRKVGIEFTKPTRSFWGLAYDFRRKIWESAEG